MNLKSLRVLILVLVCGPPTVCAQEAASDEELAELLEQTSEEPPEQVPEQAAATPEPVSAATETESKAVYSGDTTQLENITVTATKRAKQQRDISGSIGAIRGETLEKMGAQSMKDYMKLIPGVKLSEVGGVPDSSIPIIRGIATSTTFTNAQVPTGTYVDDLPFTDISPTLSVPDVHPFDLERVEVLKGPQGTLFGSGALAGAVRFVLNKPQPGIWEGKLQQNYTYNNFGEPSKVSAGAINIPLGDAAAIRAVGVDRRSGGIVDDVTRPAEDIDSARQKTWRVLGAWNPRERLQLSAFHFSQETEQDDTSAVTNPERFEREGFPPFSFPTSSGLTGTNLQASYDFDWGRLLGSTNRITKSVSRFSQGDSTGTGIVLPPPFGNPGCQTTCDVGTEDQPLPIFSNRSTGDVKGDFHEVRLNSTEAATPWEWLVGAAYLDYTSHQTILLPGPGTELSPVQTLPMPVQTPFGPISGTRELQILDATIDFFPTERALFGEVTRALGERWEATGGGRYFKTSADSRFVRHGVQTLVFFTPAVPSPPNNPNALLDVVGVLTPPPGSLPSTEINNFVSTDEEGFNPKFSLRYTHNPNAQVYMLAAKGFQNGGTQFEPPALGQGDIIGGGGFEPSNFKSSSLWNYEFGLRTEWFDNRLRFDTVFFYLDWKDLQLGQTVFIFPEETRSNPLLAATGVGNSLAFFVIGNVGAAHSEGVEVAFEINPFDGLSFTSAAAWIKAVLDEPYDSPDGLIAAGTRLPGTPKFQIANVVAYQHLLPFTENWLGSVALTHAHTGEAFTSLVQDNPIGNYDTLDFRLGLSNMNQRWYLPEVNLGINNLTDERGVTFASTNNKGVPNRYPTRFLIRPRSTLLSLAWRF